MTDGPSVITLGGRTLQVIANGPVKHDMWMSKVIRDAGITWSELPPGETLYASAAAFVERVMAQVVETGTATVLLGGMLAPVDLDLAKWTPAVAAEVTAYLDQLIDPDDKARVRAMVAEVIAGFFRSGLMSLTTAPTTPATPELSALPTT